LLLAKNGDVIQYGGQTLPFWPPFSGYGSVTTPTTIQKYDKHPFGAGLNWYCNNIREQILPFWASDASLTISHYN